MARWTNSFRPAPASKPKTLDFAMDRRSFRMLLLSAVLTLASSVTLAADEPLRVAQARRLSREDAAMLVQRQVGGRVLAAELARSGSREVYRVKILTSTGEVRIVLIDAATGQLD